MKCNNCGAKILQSTSERTRGLCKPCWKDKRRKRIGETAFGKAYDTYFHRPGCLAEKYFDCWIDLELKVSGPLYAARDEGDVRFILRKKAIDAVKDFDDLVA